MRSYKDLSKEDWDIARQWSRAEKYIPISECEHRRLYLVQARNFIFGIYNQFTKSFLGVRYKFGREFIDFEDHWDTGEPHGTVKPLEALSEVLPAELDIEPGTVDGEVYNWLKRNGG